MLVKTNIYGPLAAKESQIFDIIKKDLNSYTQLLFEQKNKDDTNVDEKDLEDIVNFLKG